MLNLTCFGSMFSKEPADITTSEGESILMECNINSTSDLVPIWSINHQIYPSTGLPSRYRYIQGKGLEIESVDQKMNGSTYECCINLEIRSREAILMVLPNKSVTMFEPHFLIVAFLVALSCIFHSV